ncbi:hypothetical protein HDU92_006816 [Lobulomyces angularis]|nr:hypothetical protein HDU92_006816 [Lobulomyces angularis]
MFNEENLLDVYHSTKHSEISKSKFESNSNSEKITNSKFQKKEDFVFNNNSSLSEVSISTSNYNKNEFILPVNEEINLDLDVLMERLLKLEELRIEVIENSFKEANIYLEDVSFNQKDIESLKEDFNKQRQEYFTKNEVEEMLNKMKKEILRSIKPPSNKNEKFEQLEKVTETVAGLNDAELKNIKKNQNEIFEKLNSIKNEVSTTSTSLKEEMRLEVESIRNELKAFQEFDLDSKLFEKKMNSSLVKFNSNLEERIEIVENFNAKKFKKIEQDILSFEIEKNRQEEKNKNFFTDLKNILNKNDEIRKEGAKNFESSLSILEKDFEKKFNFIKEDVDLTKKNQINLSQQKLDVAVLEELMKHIPTREELKKTVRKVVEINLKTYNKIKDDVSDSNESNFSSDSEMTNKYFLSYLDKKLKTVQENLNQKIQNLFQQEMSKKKVLETTSQKFIDKENVTNIIQKSVEKNISSKMDMITKNLEEVTDRFNVAMANGNWDTDFSIKKRRGKKNSNVDVDENTPSVQSASSDYRNSNVESNDEELSVGSSAYHYRKKKTREFQDFEQVLEQVIKKVTRDFDEKLYLICSDLSLCKQSLNLSKKFPLNRVGCWLWRSNTLKFGSVVPWNYESLNTDPENFRWQEDSSCIKIQEPGLYEIRFAFFTKQKPSIQLLVNGESILSAINSPSYVVHHGSGFVIAGDGKMVEGCVSGLSLLDFLSLPARSTVSLIYTGKKNGHGFLSLKKVY